LRPQAANADAQDWIDRVYANGGTVSTSTANAVNSFCDAIDAAGIRDRFYRLNLFAGTGLNAALVPVYRGTSLGGTLYGNTTDTNNGPFVSGDYSEATGLYPGATNTSKYLNTGFPANTISAGSAHLGLGILAANTLTGYRTGIGTYNNAANAFEVGLRSANSTQLTAYFSRFGTATDTFGDNIGVTGSSLAGGNIVAAWPTMYRGGVATGTDATTSQDYPSAHNFYVFANNNSGTSVINYSNPRLGWYSVGETMTSAQAEDFNDALVALYSSLGRS
jgi:hypothetical protein